MRIWIGVVSALAALYGACGVALAAAGAHVAANSVLAATAADFLLVHAVALVGMCTAAATCRRVAPLMIAASMIALGTLLFSGHLALHALAGLVPLPFAAPIGGSLTILGWLVAVVGLPLALAQSRPRGYDADLERSSGPNAAVGNVGLDIAAVRGQRPARRGGAG